MAIKVKRQVKIKVINCSANNNSGNNLLTKPATPVIPKIKSCYIPHEFLPGKGRVDPLHVIYIATVKSNFQLIGIMGSLHSSYGPVVLMYI